MSAAENADVTASSEWSFSLSAWCVTAAFGTYFCMYAFRKPFTAATFSDQKALWGISYKPVLLIAQTFGYMLSKFLGIKIIAEMPPGCRVALLLALIAGAEAALLLFAVTPPPFNVVWLFVNGVPLGMVFGLVLGFLEGRRHTEALTAGLCVSFIVAGGVTKSTGAFLIKEGVTENWMPFAAGLLFVPPLLLFAWMLTRIPAPSPKDVAARSVRAPMSRAERWRFFRRYSLGLALLIVVFVLITILRSVRDDFAPEIWAGLQTTVPASVYTWSEIAVGAGVLLLNGSVVLIHDNRRAFFTAVFLGMGGVILVLTGAAGAVGRRALALRVHGPARAWTLHAVHRRAYDNL